MFDFTDGVHKINTRSTGRFLSTRSFGNGNIPIQFGGNVEFGWNIIDNLDGTFAFQDYISGEYLEGFEYTSSGSTLLGATLATRNPSEDKQAWFIQEAIDSEVRLKNKFYDKYLTALGEEDGVPPPEYADSFDYQYHARTDTIGRSSLEDFTNQFNQIWRISKVTLAPVEGFSFPQVGFAPIQEKVILFASAAPVSDLSFAIVGPESLSGTMEFLGQYVEPTKGIDFINYYYRIDISDFQKVGIYKVSSNGFEDEFIIGNDIYSIIRGVEGIVTFEDFINNGFWANNRITTPHTIDESIASDNPSVPGVTRSRPFVELTGNLFTVSSGWFDAHSRDMKMARESMNLYGVCLAALESPNTTDRLALIDFIIYTANSTLSYQNADGSWPIGKVRRYDNSNLYSWTINLDTGNVAKCVRALAFSAQILKDADSSLATSLLNACYLAWNYIENHSTEDDFIGNWLDVTYTGTTIDIVGAGVEMYIATKDPLFKNYVDHMILNSEFRNGLWRYNLTDMYIKLSPGATEELRKFSIFSYIRYYDVATDDIKPILENNMKSIIDHWNNRNSSPYDTNVRELSTFGRAQNFSVLSLTGLYIYDRIQYEAAKSLGTNHFNWVVGFNPLFESAILGVGREASVDMFKQPFRRSGGALVPSIIIDPSASPVIPTINFGGFQSSEATVISSSLVFGLFVMMNKIYGQVDDVNITMVKSSDKNIANVGDTITYTTIITNNGTLTVNNVIFTDPIPDGTEFITGSVTIDGMVDINANPSSGINLGSIDAGVSIVVSFMVFLTPQLSPLGIKNISTVVFEYEPTPGSPIVTGTSQSNPVIIEYALTNFKQIILDSNLTIPRIKPDIEDIVSVTIKPEISQTQIIQTSNSASLQGDILRGYKLIIYGRLNTTIEYIAYKKDQSVHVASYSYPFKTFLVLPEYFNPEYNISINFNIEDIYYKKLDERNLYNSITMLLTVILC